jgi:hypothetical protein
MKSGGAVRQPAGQSGGGGGPAGAGHRLSGKTLIFVIDLLGVR